MASGTKIKANLETAKSDDHTGAGASFVALGTPLSQPANILIITSTYVDATPVPISAWLSTNATDDQILVPGQGITTINLAANKQGIGSLSFAAGTQFYLKQGPDGAPTAGDFSLSAVYAT